MSWSFTFTIKLGKDKPKDVVFEKISYTKKHFLCGGCKTRWYDIDVVISKCPSCGVHSNTVTNKT